MSEMNSLTPSHRTRWTLFRHVASLLMLRLRLRTIPWDRHVEALAG